MKSYAYHLFGANGSWPDDIGPPLFEIRCAGSTVEKAIADAKRELETRKGTISYDFAWLKDDDGWTVWASAEDG